jgi:hypothetical protein
MLSAKQISVLLLVIGAIMGVIGNILYQDGTQERQQIIDSTKGSISSPESNSSFVPNPDQLYLISVGAFTTSFRYEDISAGFNLRRIVNIEQADYDIQLKFDQNYNLLVSTKIRNEDNQTIAYIINNQWATAETSSLLIGDRNFNSYAFELIGIDDLPILQVLLVNQTYIKIGVCLKVGNTWDLMPIDSTSIIGCLTSDAQGQAAINYATSHRLFQYPSAEHVGQLTDSAIHPKPFIENTVNTPASTPNNYPSSDPLAHSTTMTIAGVVMQIIAVICGGMIAAVTVQDFRLKKAKKKSHRQRVSKK